jgi:hypothetical protein
MIARPTIQAGGPSPDENLRSRPDLRLLIGRLLALNGKTPQRTAGRAGASEGSSVKHLLEA